MMCDTSHDLFTGEAPPPNPTIKPVLTHRTFVWYDTVSYNKNVPSTINLVGVQLVGEKPLHQQPTNNILYEVLRTYLFDAHNMHSFGYARLYSTTYYAATQHLFDECYAFNNQSCNFLGESCSTNNPPTKHNCIVCTSINNQQWNLLRQKKTCSLKLPSFLLYDNTLYACA